jgi:hypothetical protein
MAHQHRKLAMNYSVCLQIGTTIASDGGGFGEGFSTKSVEEGRGYL